MHMARHGFTRRALKRIQGLLILVHWSVLVSSSSFHLMYNQFEAKGGTVFKKDAGLARRYPGVFQTAQSSMQKMPRILERRNGEYITS